MKSGVVAKNVLRRVFQDPRTLLLVLITPLLFMVLFGYAFSGSPQDLALIVVNEDNGLASVRTERFGRVTLKLGLAQEFIDDLDLQTFHLIRSTTPEAAQARVRRGEAWAALIFPVNFSHALVNEALRLSGPRAFTQGDQTFRVLPPEDGGGEPAEPLATLVVDNSSPIVEITVLEALRGAFSSLLQGQQAALNPMDLLTTERLYPGEITRVDYSAPGVIGFAITLITTMLSVVSIVRDRTGGVLTRVLIAPVRPWEASLGYTLAFTIIGLLQVGELLGVSHALFGIRFAGHPGWAIFVIVLFTLGLQGAATLLSTVARNEFQAVQYLLVILIPAIMISGVFWPIEAMPSQIRWLAWISPLTHANTALRDVMLRGWGLPQISPELLVLAGFALAMLILSFQSMRRRGYAA